MERVNDSEYVSIIPTAFVTAYPRTLTDISYSKDIFEQLLRLREEEKLPDLGADAIVPRLAPELEARYKLIDRLVGEAAVTQVLELAAGLSPRGLIAAANPTLRYAELDLPAMVTMKRKILNKIADVPHNLHLVEGNALRFEDMQRAVADFDASQPLAVVNEGLLRYLNFDEKAQVAANVHKLLERFGGAWITCDTTPKKFLAVQNDVTQPGFNAQQSKNTGKNFDDNMFEDLDHAARFFEGLGFTVEAHQFREIEGELSSPARLGLSANETAKLLNHGVVVVMRPK